MPNLPISGLTSGSALTGTESFVMVQDGVTKQTSLNSLYTSLSSNYGLFNQTGSLLAINGTLGEATIIGGGVGTLSVPANGFSQGDAFHVTMTGTGTFQNNDTLTIRVKTGVVVLATTGAITLANAGGTRWKLDMDFSIHEVGAAGVATIVSAGIFTYTKNASTDFIAVNFGTENSTTFDTTTNNTLNITAQFNDTSNVITSRICTLRKTY